MNNKRLEIDSLHKWTEEDNFDEGCIPGTLQTSNVDFSGKWETVEEMLEDVTDFLCIPNNKENYELNSCDEEGRIDFFVMENAEGLNATTKEREQWKEGKLKLWSCIYIAYVEHVTRKPAQLLTKKGRKK